MSYGHGANFEADPARLSAFISEARSLAKRFQQVANDFPAAVAPTSMWYGVDDEYAREMGPQADREYEYVQDGLNLVAEGFGGSIDGHFLALQKITSTQSQNLDDIGTLHGRLGSLGEGGTGSGSGDGNHGRN
ncbi:hypothetical protein [Streptomyces qinzhouensis]|uniref:WXG100 family type VII secretion target n=1 Tax=Streptomyces qinzhouensis TaxID=2599401 RepID=A0A5B8JK87_9ACTN|nr:hypothetical protein [Streptomyces qinzhouensis]QDY80311.1 hypothetical protein FQU76_31625 [Streptomyces qinzhouensis]